MLRVVVVPVTSLKAVMGKMVCLPACTVFMVKVGTPSAVTPAFLSNVLVPEMSVCCMPQ